MAESGSMHLFKGFGVELEYMIVDRKTLNILPIADKVLKHELGHDGTEYEADVVTWSGDRFLHLIELKGKRPGNNFNTLESAFADSVKRINAILEQWGAMLLGTSSHPWMNPATDVKPSVADKLESEILYNKIFNTGGHGWLNAQYTHLTLPFHGDTEFEKLHAAIRLVLPIIPALCASSPILDGKLTGALDSQLSFFRSNHSAIPFISGRIVPEPIFSRRQYEISVYNRIKGDLSIVDPTHILDPALINFRGATPRFERGSIEIKIMNTQESPPADFAIQTLIIETIRALVNEQFCNLELQLRAKTEILAGILDDTAEKGQSNEILSSEYPGAFGLEAPCTAGDLWRHILNQLTDSKNPPLEKWEPELSVILNQGTLSDRIINSMNRDYSKESIREVYRHLSDCLAQNKMFII